MSSLVTGASGFLGGRLAQMLQERGEDVVVLARPTSDLRHLSAPVRIIRGDLLDQTALQHAVRDVQYIYHCAACSTDWAPRRMYYEANVLGTRNLLAAAQRVPGLQRLLHVSTTDVYGYPEMPCLESNPFVDAGLPYNQTKGQGEALVWRAHSERGLPVTILRPATIYGPRGKDFTLEIATLLRRRLMTYINAGAAPGGFTYVDNVAQALLDAAESPHTIGEAYNISDGTGATWKRYLMLFAEQLGTKPPLINLSFQAALFIARTMEAPYRYFGLPGRPLLTQHAVQLLGRDQEFPIEKARSSFGFSPAVSLEEGLRRSVAWLREMETLEQRGHTTTGKP